MLQNPSKYHTNPLSHFLALHNTQATAHNGGISSSAGSVGIGVQPHTLPTAVAAAAVAAAAAAAVATGSNGGEQSSSYHNTLTNEHHHHQLHPNSHHHHHHAHQQHPTQQHNSNSINHHLQQHHHQQKQNHNAQLIVEAAHTSLDVGKSFTIAAILGLQKSAIEQQQRKEYNDVINLSLNASSSSDEDISSKEQQQQEQTNFNNNNNNNNKIIAYAAAAAAANSAVNNFNCDSNVNLINRYLPTATTHTNGNSSAAITSSFHHTSHTHSHSHQHSHHHQQQQQQQQNVRANTFVAAAAVAAAAAAAPSALQSLQQLQQQHAQQATLNFQREKLKSENAKKHSLKNKRVRTIFTPEQLERLEAEFERQQYMVGPERLYLAHTLQLTEAQVKVWFQNRRIKWRKHHLEITQQRLALIRQNQLPSVLGGSSGSSSGIVATAEALSPPTIGASTPSIDDNEDSKHGSELRQLDCVLDGVGPANGSGGASDSELSICNDSMDADSLIEET